MDIQEATIFMARLFKQEADYYNKYLKGKIPQGQNEILKYRQCLEKYEILRAHTREFGNELAAQSTFFNVLESWKVVVKGKSGISLKDMKEGSNSADIDNLIEKTGGMASNIKKFLRNNSRFISDMSVGEDGWDIAVMCTEKDSKDLCSKINRNFNMAINLDLITISRRFAGQHFLPGLYNHRDAERILNFYGE